MAKGVYLHTGGTGGTSKGTSVGESESWTTMDAEDEGTLWLSNKRMIFVGNRKETEVPYTSIATVTPFSDALRVDRANKKPLILKTGSPKEAVVLQRLIVGQIEAPAELLANELSMLHKLVVMADETHGQGWMDESTYTQIKAKAEEKERELRGGTKESKE